MSAENLVSRYLEYVAESADTGYIPVTALDYSSLYPSLIMAYNLTPEALIIDEEEAKSLEDHDLHSINFEYNYEDYLGNPKSTNIRSWTVRHSKNVISGDKKQTNFGLYPSILQDLFNQRAEMKKSLAIYENKKEHMEKHVDKYAETKEYQECLFNLNYCDTKQKALKVYMNCFYGELGNQNSPLFILDLAGGITSMGQYNLKKVKKFIESKGCKIYYGDTDSLYFSFHKSNFTAETRKYMIGELEREEYSTILVTKTFDLVKVLSAEVNDFLINDNNTKFLKMAYEEVLYPVTFLARKKYYGVAHKGLVNFKPEKLFIRGLEVKKRGVSEILRIVCMETMWESMCVYNNKSLFDLVMSKIDYLYTKKWEPSDFLQTAIYKPGKKNVSVVTFRERMIADGREPPPEFERFSYVIVKITDINRLYNYKGNKIDIKKGDRMEYLDYAIANGMEIDLDYYFEKQLTGQFARLICYKKEFSPYSGEVETEEMIDKRDELVMKKCKKYIGNYAKKYVTGKVDNSHLKENFKNTNAKKSNIVSRDKRLKLLMIGDESQDKYMMTMQKATALIDMKSVEKDAASILADLKGKVNVTKMFSTPSKQGKYSYKTKMIELEDIEINRLIKEFVEFCDKSKISHMVFRCDNESGSDGFPECKIALSRLIEIAACIKQKKTYELIAKLNLESLDKVNKYVPPSNFSLSDVNWKDEIIGSK